LSICDNLIWILKEKSPISSDDREKHPKLDQSELSTIKVEDDCNFALPGYSTSENVKIPSKLFADCCDINNYTGLHGLYTVVLLEESF
jgi:hypothetical protein